MASKSRSKTPVSGHSEPQVSSSERPSRPASPNSTMLLSRLEEKKHLAGLNDRLASYIDLVRGLQVDKQQLSSRIETIENAAMRERSSLKTLYEKEISDSRRALDNVSEEKARLLIELGKIKNENDELNTKLNRKDKDTNALEKKLQAIEKEVRSLQNDVDNLQNLKAKAEETRLNLVNELRDKEKELKVARTQIEQETLLRVKLENELLTTKESLVFEQSMHQEELNQSRHNVTVEMESRINEQLQQQYDQRLHEELQELRADNEEQLLSGRRDLEARYEEQINSLREKLNQKSNSESKNRSELQAYKTKYETVQSKIREYEGSVNTLNSRVKDLEHLLEQEREWNSRALSDKEQELSDLRDELKDKQKEYQELLDVKVALDMELNTYHKLLEGEESRLSIGSTGTSTPSRVVSPRIIRSAGKRKAIFEELYETNIEVDSNSNGVVQVNDHDVEGTYVTVLNSGEEEISLGGWQLVRAANDVTTTYKFPRNFSLQPSASVNVWSADTKHAHNAPTDLLMKNQNWACADEMVTRLLDGNGEEVAHRQTKKTLRTTKRRQTADAADARNCAVM